MNRILERNPLNARYTELIVSAPLTAQKVQPGQFALLRPVQDSVRFPLVIADFDRRKGTITFIYEKSPQTAALEQIPLGGSLYSLTAPLGKPSTVLDCKMVCIAAHGFGCAAALPVARQLHDNGCIVHAMLGFDNAEDVILLQEFEDCTESLGVMTLDGSFSAQTNVPDAVEEMLLAEHPYDAVFAAGPLVMLRDLCNTTRRYHVQTVVSLNPIIMDGMGMCGCCRVLVHGESRLACVDGPEFDGHAIDFENLIQRSTMLDLQQIQQQLKAMGRDEHCNLLKGVV